jgi:hypothetical protein
VKHVYILKLANGKYQKGSTFDPLFTLQTIRKSYPTAAYFCLHLYPLWAAKKIETWLKTKLNDVGCAYWERQNPAEVRAWLDKIIKIPPMNGRELECLQLMLDCNRDA